MTTPANADTIVIGVLTEYIRMDGKTDEMAPLLYSSSPANARRRRAEGHRGSNATNITGHDR